MKNFVFAIKTDAFTFSHSRCRRVAEMVRIEYWLIQPALVFPTGDMGLQNALPRKICHPAEMTRVDEKVLFVAPISAEYPSFGPVGKMNRRPEQMLLYVKLGLWVEEIEKKQKKASS